MRTINSMISATQGLDLQFLIENSLIETAEDYKGLQKDQMLHGLASDGTQIGKYRNPQYAAKKAEMNPLAGQGNVDLRLTGDFFAGIFTDVRADSIIVDSADQKSSALQSKYGEKIFGLDDDSKAEYVEQVRPVFIQMVTDELNAK
jgi:hypothetical protein